LALHWSIDAKAAPIDGSIDGPEEFVIQWLSKPKHRPMAEFKARQELAGVEVLRFLCALSVLIWHYQHFFFVFPYNEAFARQIRGNFPFYQYFNIQYELGFYAVQIFWAISGFIFYWLYSDKIENRTVSLYEFGRRRFARLYPLHIATLAIIIILQYLYFRMHGSYFIYQDNSPISLAFQLIFASNWFPWQDDSFNGPIWSVSCEIIVYFLFFYAARKFGGSIYFAIIASLACFVVGFKGPLDGVLNREVFFCAAFFFAGGIAQRLSGRRMSVPLGIVALTLLFFSLSVDILHVGRAWLLPFSVSVLLLIGPLGQLIAGSSLRRITVFGNATYSSYLVHVPIQLSAVLIIDALGFDRSVFYHPIAFFIYLSVVTGASLAVYHWFEMPAQFVILKRTKRSGDPGVKLAA
jgi:peptidoglycan/LPS O-acetylase OafA/YrhL